MKVSWSARRSQWSLSLLLCSVTLLQVSTLVEVSQAAKVEKYDPANEGLFDRTTRFVLRNVLSRDDELITAGRLANEATVHPTFHPAVTTFKDASLVDDILAMPPPPVKKPGLDDTGQDLPWQIRASREASEEREKQWKVWVVLATAPQSDPLSRSLNAIFNDTLSLIFPAQTAAEEEGEDVLDHQSESGTHAKSVAKASKYNYAIVDFDECPDLMWRWWIWKVPAVLFITPSTSPQRKYDVRFWKVAFAGNLTPEKVLTYIGHDLWLDRLDVWSSTFAPGGEKDHVPLWLAKPSNWIYDMATKVPTWLSSMVLAGFGTTLITWLHGAQKGTKKTEEEKKEKKDKKTKTGSSTATASSSKKGSKSE